MSMRHNMRQKALLVYSKTNECTSCSKRLFDPIHKTTVSPQQHPLLFSASIVSSGLRTVGFASDNGSATGARPNDKFFKESTAILNGRKALFKRLCRKRLQLIRLVHIERENVFYDFERTNVSVKRRMSAVRERYIYI